MGGRHGFGETGQIRHRFGGVINTQYLVAMQTHHAKLAEHPTDDTDQFAHGALHDHTGVAPPDET